jgi:hypothetical protein
MESSQDISQALQRIWKRTGLSSLQETDADLKQALYFWHDSLVDGEYDHVVIGFDDGVVVGNQDLMFPRHSAAGVGFALVDAHDGTDGGPLGQVNFLDAATDHLGGFCIAMGNEFQRFGCAAAKTVHGHAISLPHMREQGSDGGLGW